MKPVAEFDVFGCELAGINLIEASAGTGKTWNICGLYLRLLLEPKLSVQDILVVTFTNAATAELRERIRARIVETLAWLRDTAASAAPAAASGDPFVPAVVAAIAARTGATPQAMAATLDVALQYFDEAAIFTIHGFCQRALADASFTAGLPFTLELVTDDREPILAAVHDFWRRRVADASCPPDLAAHLARKGDSPERFAEFVRRAVGKPLAQYLWPAAHAGAAPVDAAALAAAYDAAAALWAAQRAEIVAAVKAALPGLNKKSYHDASIDQAAADWDADFAQGMPLAPAVDKSKLELLTCSMLKTRTNKTGTTPAHAFFDAADALLAARRAITAALDLARLALVRDLVETVPAELRRQKRERRVLGFDDLLFNLHAALRGDDHPWLAESLRRRFPAALIDEFQDTDPLQFAIFERIYGGGDHPVFLVGDPKQAIYSFRNADLHAYLAARQHVTAEYTLAANQRSSAHLIAAQNGLFTATARAFMLPGLDYRPVTMGARERRPLADWSLPRADLEIAMLPPAPDGEPLPKPSARALAARATAAEIARLIEAAAQGRIAIGGDALQPGDIAVLVRTHAQGSEVKRELAALSVGSVELSQASVFHTPDADEVLRVLRAIESPGQDNLLRAALATEMLGCDAAEIARIAGDEPRLLGYLAQFAEYRDLWLARGVGVMYRRLLTEQKVSARMLLRDDGERRLTNLLHLGEELHRAAAAHESPDALLRWLTSQRRDETADEVAQLRLESDRNLVQIVTIHKAKGLEFPVVFCPFLWDGRSRFGGPRPAGREYHDAAGNAVIDFRDDDAIGAGKAVIDDAIRLEAAAESLRLVYVAMTRAIHRCYVVAGIYATTNFGRPSLSESAKSLLNWLAAGGTDAPADWLREGKPPAAIATAWDALARRLGPCIRLSALPFAAGTPVTPTGPAAETLRALAPPQHIAPAWQISSFSGLVAAAGRESAANDHDARVADTGAREAPPPDVAPDDILRFPRGPSAGDCLHAIFERIDFTQPGGWSDGVAQGLAAHPQAVAGGRAAEEPALLARMASGMLRDVLATPLRDGLALRTVPPAKRLIELEFSLPAPHVAAPALDAALQRQGYDVPHLGFRPLEGYLRGFVDLVLEHEERFYVLDWKSNHLGYRASDYGPGALRATMAEHSYTLQYLLYALAVDRYLAQRLSGYSHARNFGGVFYLFVRGVRPTWVNADGTPAGVFFDRPSAATLACLDACFAPPRGRASP